MAEHTHYPHLKLSTPILDTHNGRVLYRIQAGCNCVLLATEHYDKTDEHVSYYGSCGGIDSTSRYVDLVRAGLLTDLRSFLPFKSHSSSPSLGVSIELPSAWKTWLGRCNAAMAEFAVWTGARWTGARTLAASGRRYQDSEIDRLKRESAATERRIRSLTGRLLHAQWRTCLEYAGREYEPGRIEWTAWDDLSDGDRGMLEWYGLRLRKVARGSW